MLAESPKLGLVKDGTWTIRRDLAPDEYVAYQGARDRIMQFVSDFDLIVIVVMNYIDFKQYMKVAPGMSSRDVATAFKAEANRRILNLLSSVRSFLDHSETKLKRRYGENSVQFRRFGAACSSAYDNFFSYRFLYRLRNYIQHCGMPVGHISYHSGLADSSSNTIETTVRISFARDDLLQDFDGWGPTVGQELKQQPPLIPIEPLLDELVTCLQRINGTVIEDELPELEQCAMVIRHMTESVTGEGRPIIIKMRNALDGSVVVTAQDFLRSKNLGLELEDIPMLRVDPVSKTVHVTF